MHAAHEYLIKEAMRLGARVRAGLVSPAALRTMRRANMYRSPAQLSAGLAKGNLALQRQLGVTEIPMEAIGNPLMLPTVAQNIHGRIPVAAAGLSNAYLTKAMAAGMSQQSLQSALTVRNIFGERPILTAPTSAFQQMVSKEIPRAGKRMERFTPEQWDQTKNLARRHELNELRLINKGKPLGFHDHAHPQVLTREGQDLAGLDPRVQNMWRDMRTRGSEGSELADLASLPGGLAQGAYAPHRIPSRPVPRILDVQFHSLPPSVAAAYSTP